MTRDWQTTTVAILVALGTLLMAVAQLLQGEAVDADRLLTVLLGALTALGFWRARDTQRLPGPPQPRNFRENINGGG